MCYEFEYWFEKQRAEEAKRQQQKLQEKKPAEQPAPEKDVKQPDPVPV